MIARFAQEISDTFDGPGGLDTENVRRLLHETMTYTKDWRGRRKQRTAHIKALGLGDLISIDDDFVTQPAPHAAQKSGPAWGKTTGLYHSGHGIVDLTKQNAAASLKRGPQNTAQFEMEFLYITNNDMSRRQ